LRPVNRMCAGLWAASSSTVPLPTPAVPGGLRVNSCNFGRRMEGINYITLTSRDQDDLTRQVGNGRFRIKVQVGHDDGHVDQMRWERAMGSLARLLRTVTGVVWSLRPLYVESYLRSI
jgi:hypothetical protein